MSDSERPRPYLITPPVLNLVSYVDDLAAVLDASDIACVRLALAETGEDQIVRAVDALRPVCEQRDIALVVADHFLLAERLGLDGVHLTDGARHVRVARKAVGVDAIVGAYAHVSRHDGLTAGEIGADYVSFGPLSQSSLGDGALAPRELFAWWSELIEIPVVAEGGLTLELVTTLADVVDFIGLGTEIWSHPAGAVAAIRLFDEALGREGRQSPEPLIESRLQDSPRVF